MALPENLKDIKTNLSPDELTRVLDAIKRGFGEFESFSSFAEASEVVFKLDGRYYKVEEYQETVTSVYLSSHSPGISSGP